MDSNFPNIILPAVSHERASPFGASQSPNRDLFERLVIDPEAAHRDLSSPLTKDAQLRSRVALRNNRVKSHRESLMQRGAELAIADPRIRTCSAMASRPNSQKAHRRSNRIATKPGPKSRDTSKITKLTPKSNEVIPNSAAAETKFSTLEVIVISDTEGETNGTMTSRGVGAEVASSPVECVSLDLENRKLQLELRAANDSIRTLRQEVELSKAQGRLAVTMAESQAAAQIAELSAELQSAQATATSNQELQSGLGALLARLTKSITNGHDISRCGGGDLSDLRCAEGSCNHTRSGPVQSQLKGDGYLGGEFNGRMAPPQEAIDPATQSPASFMRGPSITHEDKEENVRKMYIKTKRQLDSLQALATELCTHTRSMDVNNFGEFGYCLKKLRKLMDQQQSARERQAANL